MRDDLKQHVHTCINCLRYDIKEQGYHLAKSVKAEHPWDHVQIDLIGPLRASEEGYCYILTIVDVLTSYTVLRALRTKTMKKDCQSHLRGHNRLWIDEDTTIRQWH